MCYVLCCLCILVLLQSCICLVKRVLSAIYYTNLTDLLPLSLCVLSRYQPVSYEINSRSGNESEFRAMVQTCKKAGVGIVVDMGKLNSEAGELRWYCLLC